MEIVQATVSLILGKWPCIGQDRQKISLKIVNIFLSINFNICFGCSKEQSPGSSDGTLDPWVEGHKVRTDLEKSLNLPCSWKTPGIWQKSALCPEIVLEFCKVILENMN